MIRNDGFQFVKYVSDLGFCYWCFDNWSDQSKKKMIEEALTERDELLYLDYLKKLDQSN